MNETKTRTKMRTPVLNLGVLPLWCLAVLLTLSVGAQAQLKGLKEKAKSHILADPLSISGTLGGSMTSSWNNADLHNTAPFSVTAFGNFNINIYGFSIPININFLDVSATQFTLPRPTLTFNTTPTWKNFTFYLGTGSMSYSNYTYNGISFTGVGLEYRGKRLKFGGFYGTFNRSTTFKTELDNRSAIQYLADSLLGLNNVNYTTIPQFTRKAYAAHFGFGGKRNNIDISFLRAGDDVNSLPEEWYTYEMAAAAMGDTTLIQRDSVVKGKENLCVGVSANIGIGRWLTMNGNIGASLYTPDVSADTLELPDNLQDIKMIRQGKQMLQDYGIFTMRTGSEIRLAGDAMMHLQIKQMGATLTYRFVQPNYTSLGANGFNQNAETYGGNLVMPMFKNRANFSATGYLQRDNLDKKQMYTNQVATYSGTFSTTVGEHLALGLTYNGVKQNQLDGTMHAIDSVRIDQITHTFNASPTYSFKSGGNDHGVSLNFNLLQNKNLNPLMTGSAFDITTVSGGVGYDISLTEKRLNFNANYDYSQSRSNANNYNSHALSGGTSYNFISNEEMRLSGNAMITVAYNIQLNNTDALTSGEKQAMDYKAAMNNAKALQYSTDDIALSMRIGASFTYKQAHNASFFFSISNFSDNIIIGQHIATKRDVRLNVQYSYSFASRLIKAKRRE